MSSPLDLDGVLDHVVLSQPSFRNLLTLNRQWYFAVLRAITLLNQRWQDFLKQDFCVDWLTGRRGKALVRNGENKVPSVATIHSRLVWAWQLKINDAVDPFDIKFCRWWYRLQMHLHRFGEEHTIYYHTRGLANVVLSQSTVDHIVNLCFYRSGLLPYRRREILAPVSSKNISVDMFLHHNFVTTRGFGCQRLGRTVAEVLDTLSFVVHQQPHSLPTFCNGHCPDPQSCASNSLAISLQTPRRPDILREPSPERDNRETRRAPRSLSPVTHAEAATRKRRHRF